MNHRIEPAYYFSLRHNQWVLLGDLCYRFRGHQIVVPGGFVTDLASVPFYVRPIINTYGRFNAAATVHDFLYLHKGVLVSGRKFTREECDKCFLEMMLLDGVPHLQAAVMFWAVRLNPFNWPLFKKW
jgi:hypothetical protein